MRSSPPKLGVEQVSFARLHMLITFLCSWAEGCGMTRGRAEAIMAEVLECLFQYNNAEAQKMVDGVLKIVTISDEEVMKAFQTAQAKLAAEDEHTN